MIRMVESISPASDGLSAARQRARRLRVIGVIILALGIFGADGVYWLGTRTPAGDNPLPVVGEDKNATRQSETLFGKQTEFANQMRQTLGSPVVQAGLGVAGAVILAGGFFYTASAVTRNSKIDSQDA